MAGIIEEEENATSHAAFVLFSVVVSPGFDIRDDVAGNREELVKQFPKHKDFVERFTRGQR